MAARVGSRSRRYACPDSAFLNACRGWCGRGRAGVAGLPQKVFIQSQTTIIGLLGSAAFLKPRGKPNGLLRAAEADNQFRVRSILRRARALYPASFQHRDYPF